MIKVKNIFKSVIIRKYGTVVYCTLVYSWLPQGVYSPSHPWLAGDCCRSWQES